MTLDPALSNPEQVPLTFGQRARLLADCYPLVLLVVLTTLYLMLWVPLVGGAPPPVFYLVIGTAILVLSYYALQRLRDLQAGVALVTEDLLERTWVGRSHWGHFAQLGRMRMTSQARVQALPRLRHRLVYSPASKLVWSAEPLGGLEDLGLD